MSEGGQARDFRDDLAWEEDEENDSDDDDDDDDDEVEAVDDVEVRRR